MSEQQPMLSRVADSLYWMSRYLERAENTSRLLDVYFNQTLDTASDAQVKLRTGFLLDSLGVETKDVETDRVLRDLTFDASLSGSITANIAIARENARQIREQISSEMWMQINKLHLHVSTANVEGIWKESPHNFYLEVREGSHLFQGITDATMNHNQGWQFIQLGRYIERIFNLLQLLDIHFRGVRMSLQPEISMETYFDLVNTLKSVTAYEAYCKVYTPNVQPMRVVEFLLFNADFPHSLRFCVDTILASLYALADATGRKKNSSLYRVAGRLQSNLNYDEIDDVYNLHQYVENIKHQVFHIHDMLYDTFITYPIESAL